MIRNPVLPGFHPDPSIVQVGGDYYLATSTFEWFPGVALYHSRDLISWQPAGHALTRPSQLDLHGVPDSGGIWAPSLSHADGRFWLVYTVMRTRTGPYKDMVNLLTTAPCIEGPWAEPMFLNCRGFDPSLFHDEDGRKWLVQIQWDHRKSHPSFGGIAVQEFDTSEMRLRGESSTIFQKECLIEGPNLYRKDGMYYLLLAQGGTSWNHAVSMVRSHSLLGPYERDPQDIILTSAGKPDCPLQKAGHGELVETPSGGWYLAHLASRPLSTPDGPRCPLGRETCLQKVVWSPDGWLRLSGGGTTPSIEVEAPHNHPTQTRSPIFAESGFWPQSLGPEWLTLRQPPSGNWVDSGIRPGWLRLHGRESPSSLHDQSLIARRATSLRFSAEVDVDFQPLSFGQMAGLICYYDTKTHYYLRLTRSNDSQRVLGVVSLCDGQYDELGDVIVSPSGLLRMAVDWQDSVIRFRYSEKPGLWHPVGPPLDASVLSDDFGTGLHFTGSLVGFCVQDLDEHKATADFANFRYVNHD